MIGNAPRYPLRPPTMGSTKTIQRCLNCQTAHALLLGTSILPGRPFL